MLALGMHSSRTFEMKVGMLWFDNDSHQTLDGKIQRAATYYQKKYGRAPSICYVHPSMVPESKQEAADNDGLKKSGAIEIRTALWVLPNHYWIGNNGSDEAEDAAK